MLPYVFTQWRRFFGLNISPVDPLLFVGGQFRPEQWPLLHSLGVRAVLSMQAEREDAFMGTPPEQTLRLLVPDFHAPALEQLAEGVAFIRAAHAAEQPVFVHCHAGVGRAPLMAAAYLMASRSINHRTALGTLRAARPIISLNQIQLARLREFEQRLGSNGLG